MDEDSAEEEEDLVFRTEDESRVEDSLPVVTPTSEESMVGDKYQDEEELTEKTDDFGEEDAVTPTSEEPMVGGEDTNEEEGAELMVEGNDMEQGTEEPVFRTAEVGEEGALPVVSLPSQEPVGVEDRNDKQGTEEPVLGKDDIGEEYAPTLEDSMVRDGDQEEEDGAEEQVKVEDTVSPISEKPPVGDEDEDEEAGAGLMGRDEEQGTVEPNDEVREEGAPPVVSLPSEEPMVGVEDRNDEPGTEEPTSRKDEFGEEDDLPTLSPSSEESMVRDGDSLPTVPPTSEESIIGGDDEDEAGAELTVGDKDKDEEQGTVEPKGEVGEEVTPPVASVTSGRVEEKDKEQGTDESASRKDKLGEEGAQTNVSLTSEEPVVADGNQEQEETTEMVFKAEDEVGLPLVGDEGKDGEKGTEEVTFRDKDELDEDEDRGTEELIVRGDGLQPIVSPSSEGLMAGGEDKNKKEDPDVGKPRVDDEDGEHKGTLSSLFEEPTVESNAKLDEDDKGVLPIPSLSLQEPTVREIDGELGESMLPTSSPSLEEYAVRDEDDKESAAAPPIQPPTSGEPIVRYNGHVEEDALPIVSPLLEENIVEDEGEEEDNAFLPIPPRTSADEDQDEKGRSVNVAILA